MNEFRTIYNENIFHSAHSRKTYLYEEVFFFVAFFFSHRKKKSKQPFCITGAEFLTEIRLHLRLMLSSELFKLITEPKPHLIPAKNIQQV